MPSTYEWLELAIGPDGRQRQVPLSDGVTLYLIGRSPRPPTEGQPGNGTETVTIPGDAKAVSSSHACLMRDASGTSSWKYIDLQSTNGSYRNGIPAQEFVLEDGDEVWLGPTNATVSAHLTYRNNKIVPQLKRLVFRPKSVGDSTLLGRDPNRVQLRLLSERASDIHARVSSEHILGAAVYLLEDLSAGSDTFVNQVRLVAGHAAEITINDRVRFADCEYRVGSAGQQLVLVPLGKETHEHIFARGLSYGVRLDPGTRLSDWLRYVAIRSKHWFTRGTARVRAQGQAALARPNPDKVLLHDVDFVVGPNDFVVLAGSSGSGKTTLMHTLSTFLSPQQGRLFYRGSEYTHSPEILRANIGYVPQDDIIHEQLSLFDALSFAAELRLPPSVDAAERDKRVHAVLRELRLVKQSRQHVSKLSGGQRKRANIAVELLNEPGILFLDEPTEGQDLALEESIMALLRRLANNGTSVVLVSHRLNFLEYADYVGWLAPGGYLVYYGPPEHLSEYFNLDAGKTPARRFSEVYKQLDASLDPRAQAEAFRHSSEYRDHVQARSKAPSSKQRGSDTPIRGASAQGLWWRQFGTLLRRGTKLLTNDLMFLILMIVQAPLIGLLLNALTDVHMFQLAESGNLIPAQQLFFLLSTSAVVSGVCASMRELVKERKVYWRERMVGLKLGPYLASKIVLLLVFCLYESAILVWFVLSKAAPPGKGVLGFVSVPFEMLFTLFLTMLGGTALGLLMSAIAKSQESLGLLVPLALIPQLALSKALGFSLTGAIDTISKLTFGYWAVEALGDSGGLSYVAGPGYFGPDYNPSAIHLLQRWAALIILSSIAISLVWILQIRRERYQSA